MFESMLAVALVDENINSNEVNPEKLEILNKVYNGISEVAGETAKLSLSPSFATGGVSVELSESHLDKDGIFKLKDVLSQCNNFEMIPLSNGDFRISITIKGVFKNN